MLVRFLNSPTSQRFGSHLDVLLSAGIFVSDAVCLSLTTEGSDLLVVGVCV